MRRLRDMLIALAAVGLCAWAVIAQFDDGAGPGADILAIRPIAIGEVLTLDRPLLDIEDPPKPRSLEAAYGSAATVLYTWSVPCPCILDLEPRLRQLAEAHGGAGESLRWIALAGEPEDTLESVRAKAARMQAFYPIYRDPEQRALRRLGLLHAGQVAVLDGAGRLVYRGAVDDHWRTGRAEHLAAALAAVLAGRAIEPATRPRAYGCAFSLPLSCRSGASSTSDEPSDP